MWVVQCNILRASEDRRALTISPVVFPTHNCSTSNIMQKRVNLASTYGLSIFWRARFRGTGRSIDGTYEFLNNSAGEWEQFQYL